MLLRFAVENHLSIRERQELSLAASSLKDRSDGLISCYTVKSGAVVPAVVIYGPNASGKTNVLDAMFTMTKLVLWSHTRLDPGSGVPRLKFQLDPSFSEKPTVFEIDFAISDTRYHYGFEVSDQEFVSEWLYEIPRAHRRKLFERQGQHFDFGRWLRGQNRSISRLTRTNSLFLSAAAQSGHDHLSQIYNFFQNIVFSGLASGRKVDVASLAKRTSVDARTIEFLKAIGTGVVGFRKKETAFPDEVLSFGRELNAILERHGEGGGHLSLDTNDNLVEIELAHLGKPNTPVYFDLDLESAGTKRLLLILQDIFRALDNGHPIFVDELDISLHTSVCEAILTLFSSQQWNRNGAQLIATTHDTNLMRSDVLRRDQLWFAEKNSEGATELYPLTDIRTRKGDNLEMGYLQGRYGAVPNDDSIAGLLGPR